MANTERTELVELTAEEHRVKMAELYADLCALANESRAAYTQPDHEPSYTKIQEDSAKLVEKYNYHSMAAVFAECKATDDPMLEAVKLLNFQTVNVKEKAEDSGSGSVHYLAVGYGEKQIDLRKLASKVDGGIGHDKTWFSTIEQLCLRLTLKAAGGLMLTAEEIATIDASFNMSQLAREIQMHLEDPDDPNPISTKQMMIVLDHILEQMLGEGYHAEKRDIAYMLGCFTKKSRKALSLKAANTKELMEIVHLVAHRIVMNKAYKLEAFVVKQR